MSIYQKLNKARAKFHTLKLTKTGHNKFAGYYYFELGDFLIPAMQVLDEFDLCAYISFGSDLATMKIVNMVDGSFIEITSPMSSAALKGCHEVQNLGAVQTYLRRYLWVAALEIVEHDALDASEPIGAAASQPRQAAPVRATYQAKLADVAKSLSIVASAKDVATLTNIWNTESPKFEPGSKEYIALQRAANEKREYLKDIALSALQDVTA